MKRMIAAALAVVTVGFAPAAAETMSVRLDKAEILRIDRPAAVIVVGNPSVADVTVENPNLLFVTGRAPGETNLMVLDDNGVEVIVLDLVVRAEEPRFVTVNRSSDRLATFSCDPRCIEVGNPSDVERSRQGLQTADTSDKEKGPLPVPEPPQSPTKQAPGPGPGGNN